MTSIVLSKTSKGKSKAITARSLRTPTTIKQQFAIAGDISGSMQGVKLEGLKRMYHQALAKVPNARCYVFNEKVYEINKGDINTLMARLGTFYLPILDTVWSDGATHIIFISDGAPFESPEDVIYSCRQHKNVPIDTVGISGGKGTYDEELLKTMSHITGGKFYSCDQPLMLSDIIQQLLLEDKR